VSPESIVVVFIVSSRKALLVV
jgi:hypothetical protein